MKTNQEIVEEMYKEGTVKTLIRNIAKTDDDTFKDLEQDIYISLLEYDNEKLSAMYEKGQLLFFVTRMLTNNINSSNSPYYMKYKRFQLLSNPLLETDTNEDNYE